MAHRQSTLRIRHQGLSIEADVRTGKLEPETLEPEFEIVRRDARTGSRVVRQAYDKATGAPLEESYGFRWVNEAGEEVPHEDVDEYVVRDGQEWQIAQHEPTLGRGRTLEPITWIPADTTDEYLIERTYEMWGETPADVAQLRRLALYVREYGEAPVVPIVLQPSFYRDWGIVTPQFHGDWFSLVVRVTSQKIEPDRRMPLVEAEVTDLEQGDTRSRGGPTLEETVPF